GVQRELLVAQEVLVAVAVVLEVRLDGDALAQPYELQCEIAEALHVQEAGKLRRLRVLALVDPQRRRSCDIRGALRVTVLVRELRRSRVEVAERDAALGRNLEREVAARAVVDADRALA